MRPLTRFRPLLVLVAVFLMLSQLISAGATRTVVSAQPTPDRAKPSRENLAPKALGVKNAADPGDGGEADDPYARDDAFYSRRTAPTLPTTCRDGPTRNAMKAATSSRATERRNSRNNSPI